MHPAHVSGWHDLLNLLPLPEDLCISKFGQGAGTMTDGCITARRFRRLFIDAIRKVCEESGILGEDVTVYEHDCWQHMRNVWFGNVIKHLSKFLQDIMEDDMAELPSVLQITTEIDDLLRCIEKLLAETAQYAKGCGTLFMEYMNAFHIGVYLYPIARALGGTRQDIGLYGAPAVLMNLKYYFKFLN